MMAKIDSRYTHKILSDRMKEVFMADWIVPIISNGCCDFLIQKIQPELHFVIIMYYVTKCHAFIAAWIPSIII